MSTTLKDVIHSSIMTGIERQRSDGSFPAGHNGPRQENETPVRNTAHWLTALCNTLIQDDDPRVRQCAHNAVDYLCSANARPDGGGFYLRSEPGKSSTNGLIGQAWVIEALAIAYRCLDRQDAYECATEVVSLHQFDPEFGLWKCIDLAGSPSSFSTTTNQQIWFSAAVRLLSDKWEETVSCFLDNLKDNLDTYENGMIQHPLTRKFRLQKLISTLFDADRRQLLRQQIGREFVDNQVINDWLEQAIGYHSFSLYGLTILYTQFPSHQIWESKIFDDIVKFTTSRIFWDLSDDNIYSFSYNPTGFEVVYFSETFSMDLTPTSSEWLTRQLTHLNTDNELLSKYCHDSETLAARIYEATRLDPSREVHIP